jgi:eukaryotic-like serine/threonine-protein kinase
VHGTTSANVARSDSGADLRAYAFDEFTVDVDACALQRGDTPIPLPSRAFDVLAYLIEHRERSVRKDEIIAAIWDDVVVTDDSLIHAISVLRRALGDERHDPKYIETIPRRGYRFVAKVRTFEPQTNPLPDDATANSGSPPAAGEGDIAVRPRGPPKAPSGPFAWMAAAAGVAALLVVFLVYEGDQRPGGIDSSTSIRLFQPPPPGTSIVSGGVLSPNGRYLTFVARDETDGQTGLWVRALHSGELRLFAGTAGASKPFWSPDSTRIGFFSNGKLIATDLNGGTLQTIATVVGGAGASWGHDDTILFAEWASGLYRVPASGDGEVEAIASLDREAGDIVLAWPQFLPDGRRFLYQIVSLDPARTGVHVGDVETLQSFRLLDTTSPATLVPPNYVLHVQKDMLIAEELDLQRLELTGHAIVVGRGISQPSLATENVVSASADLVAFQQGVMHQDFAWFDRSGEALGALSLPTVLYNPRISPDGSVLLASGSLTNAPGLWLVNLTREHYTRLEIDAIAPVWSPDGQSAAFTSRSGFDVLARSVVSQEAPRLLASDNAVKILNDWTPDGSQLIYTKQTEGTGLDLWTLRIEDGSSRPLLATPYSETQARISPDGNWIAYSSDESGVLETYVARFPGFDDKRMVSAGGGGQPQWRSDQGELFYLSLDRAIMAVGVSSSDPIAFDLPRQLIRPPIAGDPADARDYYAVDDDGMRFLIDGASNEGGDPAITVIVNWASGAIAFDDTGPELFR